MNTTTVAPRTPANGKAWGWTGKAWGWTGR